ncbi:hypothetical protein [Actinocorallia longicatena]|uniref:hypothetical protein n=1 Tax=Actinocorallia longicatena TaxID=111803 RepID=UPI0031D0605F
MVRRLAWLFPISVVLWAAALTLGHTWGGDMRLHVATVLGILRDPADPLDPLVGAVHGSPYYSPYTYLLAGVSRLTGLAPQAVLEVAGVLNVALWLWALHRFCRRLGPGPLIPALALLFTLLLWGLAPRAWSGFLGLFSLSWTMAYPSMIASALMLVIWDLFLGHRADPRGRARPAALAVLLALVVLVHPFTAVNTVLGLGAFALADPRAALRDHRLYLAGAGALGLALLWPFGDVTGLFGAAEALTEIHRPLADDLTRQFGLAHYGLALVGLPALWARRKRPLGREMLLLCGLGAAVVATGVVVHSWGLARVIPVVMLPLHLSPAAWFAEAARGAPRVRFYAGATAAACLTGLYGGNGGLTRLLWRPVEAGTLATWESRDPAVGYAPLAGRIGSGEVVATETTWSGRVVNAHGGLSLVPAWPYPFVRDEPERIRAVETLFAAGTPAADRQEVVDRYGISCLLAGRGSPALGLRAFVPVATAGEVVLACRR